MFKNRVDGATKLSTKLLDLYNRDDVLVLGISAGGMVTACEVARQLNVAYDMLTVRKLRVPDYHLEPLGAIAIGGETVFNWGIIKHFKLTNDVVTRIEASERRDLLAQDRTYRADSPPLDVHGRTIVLVDDSISTGVTMRASIDAMRVQSAREIIIATPVASPQVAMMFEGIADRTVCLFTPRPFESADRWYDNFDKPTDDDIRDIVKSASLLAVQ